MAEFFNKYIGYTCGLFIPYIQAIIMSIGF